MRNIIEFILERMQETQGEILTSEVSLILKPFRQKNSVFDYDKVDDVMSREGWEYENEEDDKKHKETKYIWSKKDFKCFINVDSSSKKIVNFSVLA